MKRAIICDIDGTLADSSKRAEFLKEDPPNWEKFFDEKLVSQDDPIEAVLALLDGLSLCYRLIFLTGRMEKHRSITETWFFNVCDMMANEYTLIMRSNDDYRPDFEYKEQVLKEQLNADEILFVLEDRQQCVDMWRRNGIACFQVAEAVF